MRSGRLKVGERKALAEKILKARDKRGWNNEQLAERAGCGERTVRKLIQAQETGGKVRAEVCAALELPVDGSDADHGGYTFDNFEEYVGHHHVYRRRRFPNNIIRSVFDVRWDKKRSCLVFEEHQRYQAQETHIDIDYSQSGEIFFSHEIGLLHFVSRYKGAVRMMTVSRFRLNNPADRVMRGIVLTQTNLQGQYQPFTAAVIFQKVEKLTGSALTHGAKLYHQDDSEYEKFNQDLLDVERHMVIFALGSPTAAH